MDEALTGKFKEKAEEQDAEVRLLEGGGLSDALKEIARDAGAATFSVSDELRRPVADALSGAGLKEVGLSADIAVTGASWAVAETGSLVVEGSRGAFITAGVHVAVVDSSKLVAELDDIPLAGMPELPFTLVTGPSRTADIERVLVLGAHGPRRLVVLIVGA